MSHEHGRDPLETAQRFLASSSDLGRSMKPSLPVPFIGDVNRLVNVVNYFRECRRRSEFAAVLDEYPGIARLAPDDTLDALKDMAESTVGVYNAVLSLANSPLEPDTN